MRCQFAKLAVRFAGRAEDLESRFNSGCEYRRTDARVIGGGLRTASPTSPLHRPTLEHERPRVRALYWGSAAAASSRHYRGQRSGLAPEMQRVTPRVRADQCVGTAVALFLCDAWQRTYQSGLDLNPLERARAELKLARAFSFEAPLSLVA
jgi:hypothetical protein